MDYPGWDIALLKQLGLPVTPQNRQFLSAWQAHEGGGASYNPLNTTQPWQGAGSYNSVGVRNYPNSAAGLGATAKTLRNGHYGPILAALASGNPRWNAALGQALSTWGTGSAWMSNYRTSPVGAAPAAAAPAPSLSPPAVPRSIPSHVLAAVNQGLNVPADVGLPTPDGQLPPLVLPKFVSKAPGAPPSAQPGQSGVRPSATAAPGNPSKWVVHSPTMDRAGVPTKPEVFQFVAQIAQLYGKPLTIGTGTNHNQYVAGENGVVSDHWYGDAADIPASGAALTRLGQDALIAAGMPAAQARKQKGGVYNVGGYNILFNTTVGGNHWNHLHVGLGRILGRHL